MDRTTLKHILLCLAVSATVMITGLGSQRLWDDDEPRNAGCAREMLSRQDWIVPTFNAALRAHKPVLTYWCLMLSYLVLGESEFSARLPSALAAIGTTLLTYAMGRRLFSPLAALWGALILPTTLLFVMAGRIATPDSLLIFCVTLTMALYVWTVWPIQGQREQDEQQAGQPATLFPQMWWRAAAIYAAMGLAVLAKGPVGLVLPTAIIGLFLLLQPSCANAGRKADQRGWRRTLLRTVGLFPHFLRTAWSMRPLTAVAIVALVAGPWYLAVGYQTDWQFLQEFFIKHNVARATEAMEGHRGGIWFYPLMLLVGFFPWSIFAIPVALDLRSTCKQAGRDRLAALLLLCWIGVWLGAFTLAKTKLPSYATPCFPAVALLTGRWIERLLAGRLITWPAWPAVSFATLIAVGAGAVVGLVLAAQRYLPGDEWLGIIGLVPVAGGLAGLILWLQRRLPLAIWGLAFSAAVLMLSLYWVGGSTVDRHQQAGRLLTALNRHSDRPQVASLKVLEPSWVYYGGVPIREMQGSPDEAARFLAAGEDRFVITTERLGEALVARQDVPPLAVLESAEHFLKDDRLVLIGVKAAAVARKGSTKR